MIIWKGWGVAIVGMFVLSTFGVMSAAEAITGVSWDKVSNQYIYDGSAFLATAVLTYLLHTLYLAKKRGRVLMDPNTGQMIELVSGDSLFFIPVKYWSFIFMAAAVYQFSKSVI